MDMNDILEPFNNLLKSINNNQNLLILVLIMLGLYFMYVSNRHMMDNTLYLFDNEIFKFTLFMIITYISSSSPAIGIALALIMFVSLQIITYTKFKKELEDDIDNTIKKNDKNEKFTSISPVDMTYFNDEYLINPLEKINQLAPPINFDLKLTTPRELSYQMINQGKNLLNEGFDLKHDLRFDTREKQIYNEVQKNGNELIESGINRLQIANQGEYKPGFNKSNEFTKYSELLNKINFSNVSNLMIKASYNELIYNYELLTNPQLKPIDFDTQLEKVYQSELDLLKTIYKVNKEFYSDEKKQSIDKLIIDINFLTKEKDIFVNKLDQLFKLMI